MTLNTSKGKKENTSKWHFHPNCILKIINWSYLDETFWMSFWWKFILRMSLRSLVDGATLIAQEGTPFAYQPLFLGKHICKQWFDTLITWLNYDQSYLLLYFTRKSCNFITSYQNHYNLAVMDYIINFWKLSFKLLHPKEERSHILLLRSVSESTNTLRTLYPQLTVKWHQ